MLLFPAKEKDERRQIKIGHERENRQKLASSEREGGNLPSLLNDEGKKKKGKTGHYLSHTNVVGNEIARS